MLSPADMLVVGVAALLFFGPDQLPKVARRAGQVVREVQATSASFIHEMERAADEPDHRTTYVPAEPYAPEPPTVTIDHTASEAPDNAAHAATNRPWPTMSPVANGPTEPTPPNPNPHDPTVA